MTLPGISKIFGIGDSQTTWVGRSLHHNKLLLSCLKNSNEKILSLGSGAVEPLEISKLDKSNSQIICVDYNNNVLEYFNKIVEGKIIGSEIEKIFRNKAVGKLSIRSDYKTRLEMVKICNANKISFKKQEVYDFFKENKEKYKLIVCHNLLNNIRFQPGINKSKILNFYKNAKNCLTETGIFSLVDNFEWFSEEFGNQYSTLDYINKSDLKLLFHYPAYSSEIKTEATNCINENNLLAIIHKKNDFYLKIDKKSLIKYFGKLMLEYNFEYFVFKEGSFLEFKNSLLGNTNIFCIKVSKKTYLWLNIKGNYEEVFSEFAKKGFFPKELIYFVK